ncbi:MAG: hypothetical protein IKT40_12385 [Bacilli bacterium]|nr:hypothetical protein [Bacilli bacterium]
MLILNKPRLDFGDIFKKFISSYQEYDYSSYWDGFNDDYWDELDVYGFGYPYSLYNNSNVVHGSSSSIVKKSSNRGKRGSKRKHSKSYINDDINAIRYGVHKNNGKKVVNNKKLSMGRFGEIDFDNCNDSDIDAYELGNSAKLIYFYTDVNNPDSGVEEFYNLFEFDMYLRDNGIHISDYEVQKLMNRDVSHCCCVNDGGELTLLSDHSHGALYYEACEYIGDY